MVCYLLKIRGIFWSYLFWGTAKWHLNWFFCMTAPPGEFFHYSQIEAKCHLYWFEVVVFWRIVNITVAVWTGCRLKCWLMVQNQEKDFMQKIFNIELLFAPQFSYDKNMYTVQLALLLSWCCKDDDPNDYCIVTSLLQGRWISGDDARNHKREGGGIVNCPRCTI